MIDENKKVQYNSEMLAHANGSAQFLYTLIGGRYATREQDLDMDDFSSNKKKHSKLHLCFARKKDAEIRCRKNLMNILNLQIRL